MDQVTLALPTYDSYKQQMVRSLLGIVYSTKSVKLGVAFIQGVYIEDNRRIAVQQAREQGSKYLFFLDSDMQVPDTALETLLSRKVEVVGGSYNTRKGESRPVCVAVNENVDTSQPLIDCSVLGGGCLLIEMSVFDRIEMPWFRCVYDENYKQTETEDSWFCIQCHKAGIHTWCDQTLEIRHVGEYLY